MQLEGSCHCAAVRFSVESHQPVPYLRCYCSICRKTAGTGGFAINHWLTDTNGWFLTTDIPNGLKHFVRTPMSTSMDGDFDTGNTRYKARERYSFGVSDPLGLFGSPGA